MIADPDARKIYRRGMSVIYDGKVYRIDFEGEGVYAVFVRNSEVMERRMDWDGPLAYTLRRIASKEQSDG
jgi:hypothetical protein